MATYQLTTGGDGYPQKLSTEMTVIQKTIDFSKVNGLVTAGSPGVVGSTTAPTGPFTADAQTCTIITIPAGFLAIKASIVIDAVSDKASSGITVEDADGTDYITEFATTAAINTTATAGTAKLYPVASSLQILAGPASLEFPIEGIVTVYLTGYSA